MLSSLQFIAPCLNSGKISRLPRSRTWSALRSSTPKRRGAMPVVVGLTGGVASGKSSVSAVWKRLGAYIIDADAEARAVLGRGSLGLWLVRRRFGEGVITLDGMLDRAELARVAFADARSRAALNARTHPLIIARMVARLFVALFVRCHRVIVLDTPLLFETGSLRPFCSTVVVVYCAEGTMLQRAITRGMSVDDAQKRITAQVDIERKRTLADHVIDNSGPREDLEQHASAVFNTVAPGAAHNAYCAVIRALELACATTIAAKCWQLTTR